MTPEQIAEIKARAEGLTLPASPRYMDTVRLVEQDVPALLAEVERLTASIARVRALHPKRENPRHGCCAPPKLCDGHAPECRGDHGLTSHPAWPCEEIVALDDAEQGAAAILRLHRRFAPDPRDSGPKDPVCLVCRKPFPCAIRRTYEPDGGDL